MTRRLLAPLLAGLLLAPLSSWGQEQAQSQQPSAAPARHRRARGGGSSKRRDSEAAAPMKELPCPTGFTAVTDSGPHLELAQAAAAKGGRRKKAAKDAAKPKAAKKALARRCVADKPGKAPEKTEGDK